MIPHSDRILELAVDWLTLPCCLLISSADYERVSTLTTSELLVWQIECHVSPKKDCIWLHTTHTLTGWTPSYFLRSAKLNKISRLCSEPSFRVSSWQTWFTRILNFWNCQLRYTRSFFPTLTCGVFVFSSVSAASPARLPPHSLTSLTHTHTHSLTQCAFCVAGVAQSALPRRRMHALASLGSPPLLRGRRGTICAAKGSDVRPGVPWVSASFAWQAWDNVHCALASLGSPPLLRGRRGTKCTAKGSDVRPGVPWVSASFAWQAWHNVHCQGVGCTPWRPLGLRLFCVAGVGQCALPRGRMYALASLGSPPLLRGRRGTMCTAKGSDVRPGVPWVSASFAWQAWHNVHCQRGRMYALASLGSPPLLRGRRGTMCTAKGSDVRPGVPWVSASFAWQAWDNVHFAWQAWDNVHCQGIGCTAWRPLGSASFAWQAWDNVHCQGGWMYALASLGLRFFCVAGVGQCAFYVAGVGQCALPRGRMYALASLGLRLFCVAGVGHRRSLIHSLSHSLSHSTHSLTLTHSHSLTRSLSLTNTHLLTYSLTHWHSQSHTHTQRSMDGWMDG